MSKGNDLLLLSSGNVDWEPTHLFSKLETWFLWHDDIKMASFLLHFLYRNRNFFMVGHISNVLPFLCLQISLQVVFSLLFNVPISFLAADEWLFLSLCSEFSLFSGLPKVSKWVSIHGGMPLNIINDQYPVIHCNWENGLGNEHEAVKRVPYFLSPVFMHYISPMSKGYFANI